MASLADNSVATVPEDRLHELQERLLRQPEASHDASVSGATDNTFNAKEAIVLESEPTPDTSRPSQKAIPRLVASQSAPVAQMEAMIKGSPSQEAFRELTKASSFHGYPGGDTQPMESQVYRDYTESMVKSTHTTPKKTLLKFQISPDGKATYEAEMMDKTPKTCVEGDTCFIDFENVWPEKSPTARSESSQFADLLNSPGTQMKADFDERRRDMPETPSLAGNKHTREGDILTSEATTKTKTPGFTQLFGRADDGVTMTATQLFQQTQMPSSPVVDGLRSDPIITRPSPNLQNHFSASSPNAAASSPVATRYGRMPSSTAEPKEKYTSLRESQEQRAAKLRQDLGIAARFSEDNMEVDEDDEDVDLERQRFAQRRMHRVMSDNALDGLRRFHAPPRPGSRPASSPKPSTTIDLVTPATEKRKLDGIEFDISEDGDAIDEVLADDVGVEDDQESNDQYDELGQTVLRSQGFDDEIEDNDNDDDDDDEPMFDGGTYPENTLDGDRIPQEHHSLHSEYSTRVVQKNHDFATQPSAIADSQPIRRMHQPQVAPQTNMNDNVQSSYIPGSQYSGKTSLNKAPRMVYSQPPRQSSNLASSPLPLPMEEHGMAEIAAGPHAYRPYMLRSYPSSTAAMEVPESDIAVGDDIRHDRPRHEGTGTMDSNENRFFSTARSHASGSGPKSGHQNVVYSPAKAFASQQSKSTSQTPRAAAGARHFADIVNSSSPPKASYEREDIDVVAIMSDVVTADDEEVMDVIASPTSERARKRRKIQHSAATIAQDLPTRITRTRPTPQTRFSNVGPDDEQCPGYSRTKVVQNAAMVLQDRPSRGNELRAVSPSIDDEHTSTPDSVRRRENAGAETANRLLSQRKDKASDENVSGKKPRNIKTGKKDRGHARSATPVEDDRSRMVIDETVLDNIANSNRNAADRTDKCTSGATSDPKSEVNFTSSLGTSDRVFALFKGTVNGFYPARWLSTCPDGKSIRIRFEDGNITTLDLKHVRRLEIRVGDMVKVDLPDMRKGTWVVCKMGQPVGNPEDDSVVLDVARHKSIYIQNKASRTSGGTVSDKGIEDQALEVPVGCVYLSPAMWAPFADRLFDPPGSTGTNCIRPSTPSTGLQTPDAVTPSSRTRRTAHPTARATVARPTTLREETVLASSPSFMALFSGMAFAISYGNHEAEKADVTRLITRNGGIILESGFDELFSTPSLDDVMPTSPSRKAVSTASVESVETNLQLRSGCENLGFVALIADKHSRRAKYVQALALGLPTLSGRWLKDSLDPAKNPSILTPDAVPLPWSRYLLPAGESSYLGGAIRSRTLPMNDARDARLADIIEKRDILLKGDGVLIVASKKSKVVWERRKAYAFLTLALGASAVKRVSDLAEAKVLTDGEGSKWKWVYVDGSVADASKVVFTSSKDKKRKRDGDGTIAAGKVDAKAMCAGNGKVKIVNDEFVIQSLILGALVD